MHVGRLILYNMALWLERSPKQGSLWRRNMCHSLSLSLFLWSLTLPYFMGKQFVADCQPLLDCTYVCARACAHDGLPSSSAGLGAALRVGKPRALSGGLLSFESPMFSACNWQRRSLPHAAKFLRRYPSADAMAHDNQCKGFDRDRLESKSLRVIGSILRSRSCLTGTCGNQACSSCAIRIAHCGSRCALMSQHATSTAQDKSSNKVHPQDLLFC